MSVNKTRNTDHVHRVNQSFRYIDQHLPDELTLDKIAETVHYSPYHFHRIFKKITGETVNDYIIRKRIERMALVLMHNREVHLTSLAFQYGFSSLSAFTRSFKKYYGVSPTVFQQLSPKETRPAIR